jgi:hypothetical protein
MAAYIESHTTATTGATTAATLDIDAPAGIQSGDLLIIYFSSGTVSPPDLQPVGETGWTATDLTGTTYNEIWTYYKIAGASEPSTYTIAFNNTEYATLHMLRISGADQTTPIESQDSGSGSNTTPNPPSSGTLSATKAYLSLAFAAVSDAASQDITAYPTGYTVISEEFSGSGGSGNGLHTALVYNWENDTNVVDPLQFTSSVLAGWNTSTVLINSATTAQSVAALPSPVVATPTFSGIVPRSSLQPFIGDYKSAGYVTFQTTVTVDAPEHEPGDLLFMLLSNSSTTITATGPDGESGWTKGTFGAFNGGPDSDYYYKFAGASEPSTYTFTPGGGDDFTLHALAIKNVDPNPNYGFTDVFEVDVTNRGTSGSQVTFSSNSSATNTSRLKLGILYAVVDEGQQFVTSTSVGTESNGWVVLDIAQGPTISSAYQSVLFASKEFEGAYEDVSSVSFSVDNSDSFVTYNFAFSGFAPGPRLAPLTPAVLATPTVSRRKIGPLLAITPTLTIGRVARADATPLGSDVLGSTADDRFGLDSDLSADGSRAVVLAAGGGSEVAYVKAFEWDGFSWSQLGSDIDGDAGSGGSVAEALSVRISPDGSRFIFGMAKGDSSPGLVRVYEWSGSAWVQLGSDITGATGDRLGYSVGISENGSRIVVGAPEKDGTDTRPGYVQVYDWNGSAWVQAGSDITAGAGADDRVGWAVDISSDGSRVAVGIPNEDNGGSQSGQIRLYDWNGSAWVQAGASIDGSASGHNFGYSVALSGDGLRFVGAGPFYDDVLDEGLAKVYEWNGSAWVQAGTDLLGAAQDARLGRENEVTLSHDGMRLVVGECSPTLSTEVGEVRVYDFIGADWELRDITNLRGLAAQDRFGESVSLSSDGRRLFVGASQIDGSATKTGYGAGFQLPEQGRSFVRGSAGGEAADSSETSVTVGSPPYTQDGDLVLLFLYGDQVVSGVTGPDSQTGWTAETHVADTGFGARFFWKFASSEPSTYTFSGLPSDFYSAISLSIANVDPSFTAPHVTLATLNTAVLTDEVTGLTQGDYLGVVFAPYGYGGGYSSLTDTDGWKIEQNLNGTTTSSAYNSAFVATKMYTDTTSVNSETTSFGTVLQSGAVTTYTIAVELLDAENFPEVFPDAGSFITMRNTTNTTAIATTAVVATYDTLVGNLNNFISYVDGTFRVAKAGKYLVGYSEHLATVDVAANDRRQWETWISVNGVDAPYYGFDVGYIQNVDGDSPAEITSGMAVLDLAADDTFEVMIKRSDSDLSTTSRVADRSGMYAVYLDPDWNYGRYRGTLGFPQPPELGSTSFSLDTTDEEDAAFARTGDAVEISTTNPVLYAYSARSINKLESVSSEFHSRVRLSDSFTQAGSDLLGGAASDSFGDAVAVSSDGSRIAVGARPVSADEYVQVYDWNGSAWVQLGSDIVTPVNGIDFGIDIAMSSDGSRVAIGASGSDTGGTDTGKVQVYDWNGSAWVQAGSDIDGATASDQLGVSVSLSDDGNRLAVGADQGAVSDGYVQVYDWSGSAWGQVGSDITGTGGASGRFGFALALSGDGLRMAIGDYLYDNASVGAGLVQVYQESGGVWSQFGSNLEGDTASQGFGLSVDLDADGSNLVVGQNGSAVALVYNFTFTETS